MIRKTLSFVCLTAVVVVLAAVPALAATVRYVSPTGMDNPTCDKAHPCQHVQQAVNVASPGDAVHLAPGTYVEQVTISKNLFVVGAGIDTSTIKAPDTKALDSRVETFIVDINAGATVWMGGLTVAGPGGPGGGMNCAPNPASLDVGVNVYGGATLNLLFAAVRDVFDVPASGCQRGDAISIGSKCFTCAPDVGHANIDHVIVTNYQKNGIAARGTSTSLLLNHSSIANQPSSVIASNGIEVLNSAVGRVQENIVTGNECNLPSVCGPDPLLQTQASGILSFAADPSTRIEQNRLGSNDIGIYTDDGILVRDNRLKGNRFEGIYVDSDVTGGRFKNNRTDDGNYGFYVNGGNNNRYEKNSAHGNSVVDLFWNGLGVGNTFHKNHCGTAAPSKAAWDC